MLKNCCKPSFDFNVNIFYFQAEWAALNGDNVYQYMFTFKGTALCILFCVLNSSKLKISTLNIH